MPGTLSKATKVIYNRRGRHADVTIKWNHNIGKKLVPSIILARMLIIGEMLKKKIIENITTTDTNVSGPSRPGRFPHYDTRKLSQSIFFQRINKRLELIVGTNLFYGLFLETGTSKMEARPFLVPTFNRQRKIIKAIFEGI